MTTKDIIRAEYRTPRALHNDEGMADPGLIPSRVKKGKDVFVDPEVIRRRREEKAVAKWKAAQAEEEARARGDIPPPKLRFKKREFAQVSGGSDPNGHVSKQTISIMTWNVSIQHLSPLATNRMLIMLLLDVLTAISARLGSSHTIPRQ